jgi:low temperature requirement protein LtrA
VSILPNRVVRVPSFQGVVAPVGSNGNAQIKAVPCGREGTMGLGSAVMRARNGQVARVTNEELVFDLIYAFAVTQLSHRLLDALTLRNAIETTEIWFGVWLGWQYTCWVTNWLDPRHWAVRLMLFAIMLTGLAMSAAIPSAFADGGLIFAGCYVAIQIGRTLFVLACLPKGNPLRANFQRILGWLCISGVFWIAGAVTGPANRLALWAVAVACEYGAPMLGFRLSRLGRSETSDWTIEGRHLAERCQLFVLVALGESILSTGATLSQEKGWNGPELAGFVVAFVASMTLWWLYFDKGSEDGVEAIAESEDPGRIGAYLHYIHVTLIGGIIVVAVANDLVIDQPLAIVGRADLAIIAGGPFLYLLGSALLRRVVCGVIPASHVSACAVLAVIVASGLPVTRLAAAMVATGLLITVAVWETCVRRTANVKSGS